MKKLRADIERDCVKKLEKKKKEAGKDKVKRAKVAKKIKKEIGKADKKTDVISKRLKDLLKQTKRITKAIKKAPGRLKLKLLPLKNQQIAKIVRLKSRLGKEKRKEKRLLKLEPTSCY